MCEPRLYQPAQLSSDGFHPNDAGYAILADEVVRATTSSAYPAPKSQVPADDGRPEICDLPVPSSRPSRRAFGAPLPGTAAQELLAPVPRREWPRASTPRGIRHAAGLLLVYPRDERAHVVLTVRADSLGRHGGQVSMPGGVVEPGKASSRPRCAKRTRK